MTDLWALTASASDADATAHEGRHAQQAVPDEVRRRLNGSFLGIDDLYRRSHPLPGACIQDAELVVVRKTAEHVTWLEGCG